MSASRATPTRLTTVIDIPRRKPAGHPTRSTTWPATADVAAETMKKPLIARPSRVTLKPSSARICTAEAPVRNAGN